MAVMQNGFRAEYEPIYFTPAPVRGRYLRGVWGGGSAPAPPDPVATAQAQGQANIDSAKATAELSRTNEVSPFGSKTWSQGADGKYTSTFQLDSNLQGLLDGIYKNSSTPVTQIDLNKLPGVGTGADYRAAAGGESAAAMDGRIQQSGATAMNAGGLANSQIDRLRNTYAQDFNYDNQPAMPTASDSTRKAVEDAYYAKATSRLNPQFQQAEAEMRSRLANQGLTEGSEAYNRELQQFNMGRTDAYGAATNDSIINSTSEMSKQFALELAARQQGVSEQNYTRELATREAQAASGLAGETAGIDNSNRVTQSQLMDAAGNRAAQSQSMDNITRSNNLNEQLQMKGLETGDRNNLLNTLMSLTTGAQVNAPGTGQIQVGAAPVAQSIYNSYQGQVDGYNADQSSKNSTMGAVGSIAMAAAMAF